MSASRKKAQAKRKPQSSQPEEDEPAGKQAARRLKWWDSGQSARPRCREEYESEIPPDVRAQMSATIRRYLDGESRRQDIDHLGKGIYEFRRRKGNNHYRLLFFHWGQYVVALTAFYKNQQQTPKQDLERALRRKASWEATYGPAPPPSP